MKLHMLLAAGWMCVCTGAALGQAPAPADTDADEGLVSAFDEATGKLAPFAVTFYWENDGTYLKRNAAQDRHYTNGNAVTFAHRPDWAHGFADWVTLGESFDKTAVGYDFGQMIFTPENIQTRALMRNDRPYARYLFAGVYLQRANNDTFDHAQLDLGVVGPSSYADRFQKTIHDWFDADEPMGWDHQLHDEFTASYTCGGSGGWGLSRGVCGAMRWISSLFRKWSWRWAASIVTCRRGRPGVWA